MRAGSRSARTTTRSPHAAAAAATFTVAGKLAGPSPREFIPTISYSCTPAEWPAVSHTPGSQHLGRNARLVIFTIANTRGRRVAARPLPPIRFWRFSGRQKFSFSPLEQSSERAYLGNAGGFLLKTKLRILLVEDNVADSVLIAHQLEESGFVFSMTRVQTETDFRRELGTNLPDVILSDHGLPSFSGFAALEITRAQHPALPFIFVSGSNDQDMVVQMYDEGATDYVFKRDLGDLKGAVLHALEPPPEPLPPPDETVAQSVQAELELELSMRLKDVPVFAPVMGRLLFCPKCRQSRDQLGRIVWMEDYCIHRAETVVRCQVCLTCELRS